MLHFRRLAIPLKPTQPRLWMAVLAGCVWLLAGASRSQAYEVNGAEAPLGVYADVNIAEVMHEDCRVFPQGAEKTQAQNNLKALYDDLLKQTAVSGIKLGAPWCLIQVCEPSSTYCKGDGNDWSYLDDVFDKAKQWGKTVRLLVTPGFDSPKWLLNNELKSCDGLFPFSGVGTADPDCGKVTFSSFAEQSHAQGKELPLPWADAYLSRWETFLGDLYRRYSGRNKNEFVSIDVAGPVGASAEMILPTCDSPSCPYGLVVQAPPPLILTQFFPADEMWTRLINNAMNCSPTDCKSLHGFPNYTIYKSNKIFHEQIFVDAWNVTIDSYERIFSGMTLVLVPDAGHGLPDVGPLPGVAFNVQGVDPTIYDGLAPVDCGTNPPTPPVSCQAKVAILTHFVTAQVIWPPALSTKSTEVGGMTASTSEDTGAIDVPGVKVLTLWPSPPLPPQPEAAKNFLGGALFDHPVSQSEELRKETGCDPKASPQPPCDTTEEAAFNVLGVFFNCTEAGNNYGGKYGDAFVTACGAGSSPLSSTARTKIQYVDLSYQDIKYAYHSICPSQPYPNPLHANAPTCWSLQDMLNQANFDLFTMAGKDWTKPKTVCVPLVNTCVPIQQ